MTDLSGKVALVTGSARGIGKAIAVRYAQPGADIVINYSGDEANASKTVAEIVELGSDAIAVKADVTKPADIEGIFTETLGRFGKVDIVVANAGVELVDQPILDATEEQVDRLFAVNTKGTSSPCKRPRSMCPTTVASSTSDPARPAIPSPGWAYTGRARSPGSTWSVSSPRRSAGEE